MEKGSKWLANRLHTYMKAKGPIEWILVRHKFFFIVVLTKISNFLIVVVVFVGTDRVRYYKLLFLTLLGIYYLLAGYPSFRLATNPEQLLRSL